MWGENLLWHLSDLNELQFGLVIACKLRLEDRHGGSHVGTPRLARLRKVGGDKDDKDLAAVGDGELAGGGWQFKSFGDGHSGGLFLVGEVFDLVVVMY